MVGAAAVPKALSAINGALEFLGIGSKAAPETTQIATGLYDEFGRPVWKTLAEESKPAVHAILTYPAVQKAMKAAAVGLLGVTVAHYYDRLKALTE